MIENSRAIAPHSPSTPWGRRVAGTAFGWLALWGFWVGLSRHNHPNLKLNLIASALLVMTFAAAAYANHLVLIPRYWRRSRFLAYAASLLMVMGLLALACTLAIHLVYDLLWGPDPARFGFGTNLVMEFILVATHVVLIAAVVRLRRSAGRRSSRPTIPSPDGS
ncbi:hypothetical protein [Paludisphaera mucosa]|uniref:Uncharacterized protein n=1 Tax=Paludisphaera mucosa TaxID=3030827 RepID=A0ABT6FK90_9BACT|nr:hypothetical protein [Paludisphaera mucosa]MDG3007969.1 hypothetical protein [Paludisphaera mucosa]